MDLREAVISLIFPTNEAPKVDHKAVNMGPKQKDNNKITIFRLLQGLVSHALLLFTRKGDTEA